MALNSSVLFTVLTIFFSSALQGQSSYYLVEFSDKINSTYSVDRPEEFLSSRSIERRIRFSIPVTGEDLPVNENYLDSLRKYGAIVRYSLKWLNAALVEADPVSIAKVNSFPFVLSSGKVNKTQISSANKKYNTAAVVGSNSDAVSGFYGLAFNQNKMLGVELLHEKGFHGEGLLIAVFDAGFSNYNTVPVFQELRDRNAFVYQYDLVDLDETVDDASDHGLEVLSILAGYDPGKLVGPAYGAEFMLIRSENESSESPVEECNWARAAEIADSAGADMIHSSLGYATFDNSAYNYSYQDMDGQTAISTRAADRAGFRGILVVSSAGNEGTNSWRFLIAPSDADSVLAVGATNDYYLSTDFSSYGPSADNRVKPDVSAKGSRTAFVTSNGSYAFGDGTSFSAPLVSGLAACIWQAHPELTSMELIALLRRAGHLYPGHTDQAGYGVPDYHRFLYQKENDQAADALLLAPNPVNSGQPILVYFDQSHRLQSTQVRIYDATGRQNVEYTFTPDQVRESIKLPTESLLPGVYFAEIVTINEVKTIRFMVR